VAAGIQVSVLNRGVSTTRPLPEAVEVIRADVRDTDAVRTALSGREFDAVADFMTFTADQAEAAVDLFTGRAGQYVFISSASAYQKPPARLPVTESTPLRNPFLEYSRDKIACEDVLARAWRDSGFPATVVRPSHTYDETSVPLLGGWTDVDRMRRGLPVVVHGDGTSLWTLTHHDDFARAFVGLLGHPATIGDSVHITSDEVLTWDQIYRTMAEVAGAGDPEIVHIASDTIAALAPDLGDALLGDRSHCAMFDNSKVKALVPDFVATIPFAVGARDIVAWHDADASRREVNADLDSTFDRLVDHALAHRPRATSTPRPGADRPAAPVEGRR
jgi:nucleoside-diphosphate-sugar epimerase